MTSGPNQLSTAEENIPIPEICGYEGELTQAVFDELWEIAIRWEVGDNRVIVPKARQRLIAFGPAVLPFVSAVMDDSNSGLALRAFQDIYQALWEVDQAGVAAVLRENAANMADEKRRTNALYLIGELKLIALEDVVVAMLDDPVPSLQRRAIGVLGQIGSHSADDRLIAMLDPETNDELVISAALTTLTDLEVDCYNELRELLDYPLVSVREQLVKQLSKHWETYEVHLRKDFYIEGTYWMYTHAYAPRGFPDEEMVRRWYQDQLSPQARRSVMKVMRSVELPPYDEFETELCHSSAADNLADWGFRADYVALLSHRISLAIERNDTEYPMLYVGRSDWERWLTEILEVESDPYVLSVAK